MIYPILISSRLLTEIPRYKYIIYNVLQCVERFWLKNIDDTEYLILVHLECKFAFLELYDDIIFYVLMITNVIT